MGDDVSSRLKLALRIADEAGRLTLGLFQQAHVQVERKSDHSPVTDADRGAEQLMRERIAAAFPTDGIIGEEFGEETGTTAYRWVLDPIDGTKSFICGVPLYSVLVGLLRETTSVAGVVRIPGLDECVFAELGGGTWWKQRTGEARRARVANRRLAEGVFLTSQVDSFAARGAGAAYDQLERTADITRTWGDGYGYLLVATGRADVIVDPAMCLWDAAPLPPILQEAGGTFADWRGETGEFRGEGIGCSTAVLDEVLAVTRPFAAPGR